MKTTTLALAAVSASTAAAQLNFHWPHTYRSIGGEASTPNPVSKSAAGWGFKWPHILRRDETCKPLSSIEDPVVGIDTGYIIGSAVEVEEESTIINRFLGIPFAKPPKRFERAEPAEPWASNLALKTQKYSPACVQQVLSGDSEINRAINGESENCLFLNVFQPTSEPPEGGFPVLFWIYGGSLEFGDAGQLFYEGSTLASEDVIVVTANYRTNIFGFPGSPEIEDSARNLGFFDQRLALDWVQRNIEAFNGNKDKVTIFGESAGALSVDALVTTMPDNPPFRAGILQSGTTSLANFIALNNNNTANWESLLSLTDCAAAKSGLECIKAVPALTIKELITSNSLTFYPAEDEVTLSSTPLARREAGDIAQVPMFVGSNKDEGRIYSVGADNFTAFLEDLIPIAPVRDAIAEAYPVAEYGGDFEAISAMWTDLVFTCPQSIHAEAHAESGLKTWRFFYSANFTNTNPLADQGIDLGASHSLEIPLVFGTYPEEGSTTQQKELSRVMRKAWTDFAKDPNGAGPGWAAVGTGENDLGEFGRDGNEGVEIVNREVADAKCETFELIYGALAVVV